MSLTDSSSFSTLTLPATTLAVSCVAMPKSVAAPSCEPACLPSAAWSLSTVPRALALAVSFTSPVPPGASSNRSAESSVFSSPRPGGCGIKRKSGSSCTGRSFSSRRGSTDSGAVTFRSLGSGPTCTPK